MDTILFERLLYEEESPTLDFKRDQYRFVKATDDDKAELLKDILGFVNAWRRSEAYILIGVEDVRGDRANVVGIQTGAHLDDHSLQQFVNNLTNRPVRFHYEAFGYDGHQVGIIRIEEQPRPVYLKRDYGSLKKDLIYVRRGSSTDPTKPATPEEIAQMGLTAATQSAELTIEFCDAERDDPLGNRVTLEAEFCEMPEPGIIPDLGRPTVPNALGINLALLQDRLDGLNPNFFREFAGSEFCKRLYRPVRFMVKNIGTVAARGVRVEFEVAADIGVHITYPSSLPDTPERRSRFSSISEMKHIRSAFRRSPGDVTIDRNDDRYRIVIECGDLQPGRRIWSDEFSIGKGETGEFLFVGQIFAENLPRPKEVTLTAFINVQNTSMTVDELLDLSESESEEDEDED